jgi:hypothetical protein
MAIVVALASDRDDKSQNEILSYNYNSDGGEGDRACNGHETVRGICAAVVAVDS